jgi:hypothetical protein
MLLSCFLQLQFIFPQLFLGFHMLKAIVLSSYSPIFPSFCTVSPCCCHCFSNNTQLLFDFPTLKCMSCFLQMQSNFPSVLSGFLMLNSSSPRCCPVFSNSSPNLLFCFPLLISNFYPVVVLFSPTAWRPVFPRFYPFFHVHAQLPVQFFPASVRFSPC